MKQFPMALRFESDQINQVSLIRVEGRLTNESLAELYETTRKYSNETHARFGIVDLTSVGEIVVSTDLIRQLARRKPVAGDRRRDCFIIALEGHVFGLCRMFQILAEGARPLLRIVHSIDEAIAEISLLDAPLNLQPSARGEYLMHLG
jgi:hypothetical protein